MAVKDATRGKRSSSGGSGSESRLGSSATVEVAGTEVAGTEIAGTANRVWDISDSQDHVGNKLGQTLGQTSAKDIDCLIINQDHIRNSVIRDAGMPFGSAATLHGAATVDWASIIHGRHHRTRKRGSKH